MRVIANRRAAKQSLQRASRRLLQRHLLSEQLIHRLQIGRSSVALLAERADKGCEISLAAPVRNQHNLECLMSERNESVAIQERGFAGAQDLPIESGDLSCGLNTNRLRVLSCGIEILMRAFDVLVLGPKEDRQVEPDLEVPILRLIQRRFKARKIEILIDLQRLVRSPIK